MNPLCLDYWHSEFEVEASADGVMDLTAFSLKGSTMPGGIEWIIPNKAVKVSFEKDGTMRHLRMNWDKAGRHPDQAGAAEERCSQEGFMPQEVTPLP